MRDALRLEDLYAVRKRWTDSLIDSRLHELEEILSESFVIAGDGYLRTRKDHLHSSTSIENGKSWFPKGGKIYELQFNIQKISHDVVAIYAVKRIVSTNGNSISLGMTEIWREDDNKWQINYLHYHDAHGEVFIAEKMHAMHAEMIAA